MAERRGAAGRRAFTLIEFVLVMALLATFMAFVAPRISGSIRRQTLDREALRLVALTEFARDEAVSQGLPVVVWLDTELGEFGVEGKVGFPYRDERTLRYRLREDIRFELRDPRLQNGPQTVIEMGADGTLVPESIQEIWLMDRTGATLGVVTTTNGWGYEIVQEKDYATRIRSAPR